MNTPKEILTFINRLNIDPAVTANFHTRLSFWWANLIITRFSVETTNSVEIMYNRQDHTFAVYVNDNLYDARGLVKNPDDYEFWTVYAHRHEDESNEIMRTMIYFMSPEEWEYFIQNTNFNLS